MTESLSKLFTRENQQKLIFIGIFLSFIIPYLNPIGLPIAISETTQEAYNQIENLPAGSIVIVQLDWAGWGEESGATKAVVQHLFWKDIKIVCLTIDDPKNTPPTDNLLTVTTNTMGKVYGEDWVYLGYAPGWETMVAEFAQQPLEVYTKDYYGATTADMPIMQEFINYEDVEMIVSFGGKHALRYWVYQWSQPFGTHTVCVTSSKDFPEYVMYYPHLTQGFVAGSSGGAEYELLIKRPGESVRSMDAMSMVSMFSLAVVVVSNIIFVKNKYFTKSEEAN